MKNQKIITYAILGMSVFIFSGCSPSQNTGFVNELHFPLQNLSEITISYDEEPITFFEGVNNELIIKEYMTADQKSYHAKVEQNNHSIKISEGGKPVFKDSFSRSIEVYLPASYDGALTVTSTDGDIDFTKVSLTLDSFRVDSTAGTIHMDTAAAKTIYLSTTSGTIELGDLKAEQIKITSTSGNVTCENLNGSVLYKSTSGNANIKSAIGSGRYMAENSGDLQVKYEKVTGNLWFFNKNDTVHITLPKDLEFHFTAATKNGSISTPFQENVTVEGQTVKGTVGNNPTVTIEVETKNGNIEVTQ